MTEPASMPPADARQILDLHLRVTVPEAVCSRCLTRWPCDPVRQAKAGQR